MASTSAYAELDDRPLFGETRSRVKKKKNDSNFYFLN